MPGQDPHQLLGLTAGIVASHLANNAVATADLPQLIRAVHAKLAELGQPREQPQQPAVPVGKSVARDHVVCLECGRRMKILKRHLQTDHDMTSEEYRAKWGLRADHPLVAPDHSARRQELAKKSGLGRTPRRRRGARRRSR